MANPWEFLEKWVSNNVQATAYEDKAEAKRLAYECRKAAREAGVSENGVIKAAGGNLEGFMLTELNSAVNQEVERLVAEDKS